MHSVNISTIKPNWMANFCGRVLEGQKVVRHLRWSSHLAGSLQTQNQQIQNQSIVLRDKRSKLQTTNDSVTVGVIHVLVVDHHVVFGCHVISNVVINDQTKKSIEKSKIYFLVQLLKTGFQQNVTFAFRNVPDILQIVNSWKYSTEIRDCGNPKFLKICASWHFIEFVQFIPLKPACILMTRLFLQTFMSPSR